MLDAGVDRLAPGRKRGGVMLRPETVVADLALTMLLGSRWRCWRVAASPAEQLCRRGICIRRRPPACSCSLARSVLRAWNVGARPVAAGVAVGRRRDRGRAMAIGRPRRRRGASQPRARTAMDLAARARATGRRAAVPALAGRAGPRAAVAAVARLRVDDRDGEAGTAAAAGGRTARGAVRRDRRR